MIITHGWLHYETLNISRSFQCLKFIKFIKLALKETLASNDIRCHSSAAQKHITFYFHTSSKNKKGLRPERPKFYRGLALWVGRVVRSNSLQLSDLTPGVLLILTHIFTNCGNGLSPKPNADLEHWMAVRRTDETSRSVRPPWSVPSVAHQTVQCLPRLDRDHRPKSAQRVQGLI